MPPLDIPRSAHAALEYAAHLRTLSIRALIDLQHQLNIAVMTAAYAALDGNPDPDQAHIKRAQDLVHAEHVRRNPAMAIILRVPIRPQAA